MDYGESLEDPTAFLETLGNTTELYQVHEPVNLSSCESLRNLRLPSKGRHLDLTGVALSLPTALAYMRRNGDNLRTLHLPLVSVSPQEPLINSKLPSLTSLHVTCPADFSPYTRPVYRGTRRCLEDNGDIASKSQHAELEVLCA